MRKCLLRGSMDVLRQAVKGAFFHDTAEYGKSHSCGTIIAAKNEGVWYVVELLQNNSVSGRPQGHANVFDIGAKGRMLTGETELQTAIRELFEETGLQGYKPVDDFIAMEGPYHISKWKNGIPVEKLERTITYHLTIVPYYELEKLRISREHVAYTVSPISLVIEKLSAISPKRSEILAKAREYLIARDMRESGERYSLDDTIERCKPLFRPSPSV